MFTYLDPESTSEPPQVPGDLPDLMAVLYADVGEVNPYNLQRETVFVQSVGVPTDVDVPQGVYGVRVGNTQLAAQARTVKHRPDGTASLLRVEGAWPAELTGPQQISLTALPLEESPVVEVALVNGNIQITREGAVAYTITPYAATKKLSGSKPSILKGSNSDPDYVPSTSFHEWHVAAGGVASNVGAEFVDITVEEDTSILAAYLVRGRGSVNGFYEFQMRLIDYKHRPWIRWEYTTFKHFDVNIPGETGSMDAIAAERLTFTPETPFTSVSMKDKQGTSLTVRADAFGEVTGDFTGDLNDHKLNAVSAAGEEPLSLAVRDLMGQGPSAIEATTSAIVLHLWSDHTGEALDFRGTGASGEVQADSSDYNASPRGTAKTWEGLLLLERNLPLVNQFAAWDDLWLMTPEALETSEAFGPFKAAAGVEFAEWFRRIDAIQGIHELAAIRHQHFGYAQKGLLPFTIPPSVDTALDRYVAKEPMHSGRYGQNYDEHVTAGDMTTALLKGDRKRVVRALSAQVLMNDIFGHHGMLFGTNYMGGSQDGIHRRYRDPWTGRSNDTQYWFSKEHYYSYWLGGPRRSLERGQRICEAFERETYFPYPHGPWALAIRYMHSHDPDDLASFLDVLTDAIEDSAASFPPPAAVAGTAGALLWDNFRYGHNTTEAVVDMYEATGDIDFLDALASAYDITDWSSTERGWSSYGSYTSGFYALAYLLLRGYTTSDFGSGPITSMNTFVGQYMAQGKLAHHAASLPAGDPDDFTWAQAAGLINQMAEERPRYERAYGAMIASWYATQ